MSPKFQLHRKCKGILKWENWKLVGVPHMNTVQYCSKLQECYPHRPHGKLGHWWKCRPGM